MDLLLHQPPPLLPVPDQQNVAYKCRLCDALRSEWKTLVAHVRSNHPNLPVDDLMSMTSIEPIDALLLCEMCGYKSTTLSGISSHRASCLGKTDAERRSATESRERKHERKGPRSSRKRIYEGDTEVQVVDTDGTRTVKYRNVSGTLVQVNVEMRQLAELSRALMRASVLHENDVKLAEESDAAVSALDPRRCDPK